MTGLYYYRARYYDPLLGRFISEDPLKFGSGDFNFYGYVLNDPVNEVDPEGLRKGYIPAGPRGVNSKEGPPLYNKENSRLLNNSKDLLDPLTRADCVYRPVQKCVRTTCDLCEADLGPNMPRANAPCKDSTHEGLWFVKDASKSCMCIELTTTMECK